MRTRAEIRSRTPEETPKAPSRVRTGPFAGLKTAAPALRFLLSVLIALFLIASPAEAATRFVSPLEGAQAIGPMLLEVATDTAGIDRVDFLVDGVLAGAARTAPYRIYFDFGTSLAPRTVEARVWTRGFSASETAVVRTAGITANEVVNVDVVEVPMRVRATRALKPADVRLRENGVDQVVREIRAERPPAHFAFVVDRSLSMGNGKLQAALAAVQNVLTQLRAGDSASLVLFNHNVARAVPIAANERLTERFEGITPSGGTSLRDAVASVASDDRTYAVVITDGGDRNSVLEDEPALRGISGTRTVVNALVLGDSHTRFLDRAAQNTGGSVVKTRRDSIGGALSALMSDINSRYLLVYQSHGTKRGWRSIEIRPRVRGLSVVSARRGYFAE